MLVIVKPQVFPARDGWGLMNSPENDQYCSWWDHWSPVGSWIVSRFIHSLNWMLTYQVSFSLGLITCDFHYNEYIATDFYFRSWHPFPCLASISKQLGIVSATNNCAWIEYSNHIAAAIFRSHVHIMLLCIGIIACPCMIGIRNAQEIIYYWQSQFNRHIKTPFLWFQCSQVGLISGG